MSALVCPPRLWKPSPRLRPAQPQISGREISASGRMELNSMESNSPDSHLQAVAQPLSTPKLIFGKIDELASRVSTAVESAKKHLFAQMHEDGYWCGEL